jgi:hypothetical protein
MMESIDGWKIRLFTGQAVLNPLRFMVSCWTEKSSLPCVYSPPLEFEGWDYGRRCTFITIPNYVAPNYGPISKVCCTD